MGNSVRSIPDSPKRRIAVAAIISIIIIMATAGVSSYYFAVNMKAHQPGYVPLSNITADINITPSMVKSASGTSSTALSGALIQIWPIYHLSVSGPSYEKMTNSSSMITEWVNSSWTTQMKFPDSFLGVINEWRTYFGPVRDGSTSLIVMISYVGSHNNTSDTVYTYTTTSPYNPYSEHNGTLIPVEAHPDVFSLPHMYIPANETGFPTSPVYYSGNISASNGSQAQFTPDHLPLPGGNSSYWEWIQIGGSRFTNAEIPISFLNETEKGINANVADSITLGTYNFGVNISMAKSYDYSGAKSFYIGTSKEWGSGLISQEIGGDEIETYQGNNLTLYDGVVAVQGNASIWRYQYVEYSSTNHLIQRSSDYQTNMAITSLDEADGSFHFSSYNAGYVNLHEYNNSTFSKLSQQQKYQQSFGIYFSGSDTSSMWGSTGSISSISTLSYQEIVDWKVIYTSISTTSSNVESSITSGISLLVGLAGVALALAAVPYSDAATIPALIVALVGFGVSVASLYENGVLNVTSSAFLYNGYIKNNGNSNGNAGLVTVEDWYTPQDITVNGNVYQFPSNYAIIKPA